MLLKNFNLVIICQIIDNPVLVCKESMKEDLFLNKGVIRTLRHKNRSLLRMILKS